MCPVRAPCLPAARRSCCLGCSLFPRERAGASTTAANPNTTTTHLCPSSRTTRLSRAVTAPASRAPAHPRPCANQGFCPERSLRSLRALGCSGAALECTQCIPPTPCQMVPLGTASWTSRGPLTRLPSTPQVRPRARRLCHARCPRRRAHRCPHRRARVRPIRPIRRALPPRHQWSR